MLAINPVATVIVQVTDKLIPEMSLLIFVVAATVAPAGIQATSFSVHCIVFLPGWPSRQEPSVVRVLSRDGKHCQKDDLVSSIPLFTLTEMGTKHP